LSVHHVIIITECLVTISTNVEV